MAKHRRSMDEWRAIGEGLKKLHEDIGKMTVLVGKYGYLKYGDRLSGLSNRLVKIRSDLENQMFREYRSADTSIFFGRKTIEG
jgi:hypothetical protein